MLDFSNRHYVPVLKTKQGERWAVAHTTTEQREAFTPLFEIHPHKTIPAVTHAEMVCEQLHASWGNDAYCFLDTRWLQDTEELPALLSSTYFAARTHLKAIPVASIALSAASRVQLASEIAEGQNGAAIRLNPGDLASPEAIITLAAQLGIGLPDVHVLLDYRREPLNIAFDLGRLPHLMDWRTVTVIGASFPVSLIDYPLDEWFSLPRHEYIAWSTSQHNQRVERKPSFGDYTTRDPGKPASGGKPSVNVRYTRAADWLCRMGGRLGDGASPQMKEFCELLVEHESFSGAAYSAGDAEYYDKSLPGTGTGGSGDWTKWPISHHIIYTLNQIS